MNLQKSLIYAKTNKKTLTIDDLPYIQLNENNKKHTNMSSFYDYN